MEPVRRAGRGIVALWAWLSSRTPALYAEAGREPKSVYVGLGEEYLFRRPLHFPVDFYGAWRPMVIVIDNYDSFTYNLVQRLGEIDAGVDVRVFRNDEVSLDEIAELHPQRLIISPGPCTPTEAGISVDCVKRFAGEIPLLGVCLGHQSIGQAFGATIVRAPALMHGKVDEIHHDDGGLFAGIEMPFVATRYHSLVIDPSNCPADLEVSAWTDTGGDRQIMGVRHKTFPLEGWQFHPESFLTQPGVELLKRFLAWA